MNQYPIKDCNQSTDRAPGKEIDDVGGIPYDRWNDGPPEMQSAWYHVVSEIVTGRRAPPEWDGEVVSWK